ncbi:hypothetical protein PSHT_08908 [Puccinia striiformis]|uniref:Uncharacterized protein n=1 Tax=Puccinia striiformis TaxID=27350 RepID=A0A2S4VKP7_9BASI|nr:hypothetical protein PSHT_08908 [Puccinia striiformis]
MLFKYLLAPVAFAAAAVAYGETVVSKEVDFQLIVSVSEKYQQPITNACVKESIPDVTKSLTEIYKPVVDISQKFHASIEKLEKAFVVKQLRLFFSFLISFEVILKTISQHPKVTLGCHGKFYSPQKHDLIQLYPRRISPISTIDGIVTDLSLIHFFTFGRTIPQFDSKFELSSPISSPSFPTTKRASVLGFKFQNQIGL